MCHYPGCPTQLRCHDCNPVGISLNVLCIFSVVLQTTGLWPVASGPFSASTRICHLFCVGSNKSTGTKDSNSQHLSYAFFVVV